MTISSQPQQTQQSQAPVENPEGTSVEPDIQAQIAAISQKHAKAKQTSDAKIGSLTTQLENQKLQINRFNEILSKFGFENKEDNAEDAIYEFLTDKLNGNSSEDLVKLQKTHTESVKSLEEKYKADISAAGKSNEGLLSALNESYKNRYIEEALREIGNPASKNLAISSLKDLIDVKVDPKNVYQPQIIFKNPDNPSLQLLNSESEPAGLGDFITSYKSHNDFSVLFKPQNETLTSTDAQKLGIGTPQSSASSTDMRSTLSLNFNNGGSTVTTVQQKTNPQAAQSSTADNTVTNYAMEFLTPNSQKIKNS
jgi:hypothetical protein